jgi:hypothetical protein
VSVRFSSRRPSRPLFRRPASPVRTAAAPERLFDATVSSRGGLRNRSFGMPYVCGLPHVPHQLSVGETRGPGRRQRSFAAPSTRSRHALGAAAVRTALPARSRAAVPSQPWHRERCPTCTLLMHPLMHAAGRSAVRQLLPPRARVWCRRARPSNHVRRRRRFRGRLCARRSFRLLRARERPWEKRCRRPPLNLERPSFEQG